MPTSLTVCLPNGRRLGCTRYGDPSHPVAVFHHGFGFSSPELPPGPALLASLKRQILAPDRPGVGQSDVYRGLTFPSFAADTVAVRDAAVPGFAHAGRGMYDDAPAWCRPPGFRIEAVQAPTTLWHGAADGVWAPGNISYLASRIAGARLHLLPGQGHMLYLENRAEILTRLRAELG